MSDWDRFNDQFVETPWERQNRWADARKRRVREGKCWQCAKPFADCACPNLKWSVSKGVVE